MFYLFFPILTFVLLRSAFGKFTFLILLISFVVTGPFARAVWAGTEIWREKSYLGGMDAIAMGCLCALLTHASQKRTRMSTLLLIALECIGALCLLLVALWPRWPWVMFLGRSGLDGTVLALGTCLIMFSTVMQGRSGSRWTEPIRWFGRHSYEIYLTHEFLVVWATLLYVYANHPPAWQQLWFAMILVLSGVIGALVAKYVSEPLNRKLRARPKALLRESVAQ